MNPFNTKLSLNNTHIIWIQHFLPLNEQRPFSPSKLSPKKILQICNFKVKIWYVTSPYTTIENSYFHYKSFCRSCYNFQTEKLYWQWHVQQDKAKNRDDFHLNWGKINKISLWLLHWIDFIWISLVSDQFGLNGRFLR